MSCFQGKQARTKIPKRSDTRAEQPLQLVHSDVCGPFCHASLGGAKDFVSFIDDFSCRTWVYFITRKSEVLDKFKIFQKEVESKHRRIEALRSDNGGEYSSQAFTDFCQSHGIRRELTVPHILQQNGVAERKNRSLLDITRCLLIHKQLPSYLWGEAVRTACIILNLQSCKSSPDRIPVELFTGRKPSVADLRIFGSIVFVKDNSSNLGKLDTHFKECILLSHDDRAKGYRCFQPSKHRVFV